MEQVKEMRIKGLDRTRNLAMTLVLLYHLFGTFCPGGFIGVNVLFVLSGFLITYHLIPESITKDGIDLKKFYNKRFNRIVPAVLLMVVLGLVLLVFMNSDYRVDIMRQLTGTLSFSTNWYEIASGSGYESQFIKHIFLHTWSLGIEIHFYIVWPLVLVFLKKKIADKTVNVKIKMGKLIRRISLFFAFVAYAFYLLGGIWSLYSTSFMYFSELTRLLSFFVGTFVAGLVYSKKRIKIPDYIRPVCFLALIVISFIFSYSDKSIYLIIFLLVDIISAIIILSYYFGRTRDESLFAKRLSVWTYPIYLFHWPIWVFADSIIEGNIKYLVVLMGTAIMVSFNQIVWEPFFKGKEIVKIKKKVSANLSGAIKFTVFIGIICVGAVLQVNAPDMIKLEKDIWKQGLVANVSAMEDEKKEVDFQAGTNSSSYVDLKADNSISVIGDSTMLAMTGYIPKHVPNTVVNAQKNRPFFKAKEIIPSLEKEGRLGKTIVTSMGVNDANYSGEKAVREVIESVPYGKRLIIVIPHNAKNPDSMLVKAMYNVAPQYNYVTIMDWNAHSKKHPELYKGSDGVHFFDKYDAYKEYTMMLMDIHKKALAKSAREKK
ncbi:MAG: acyltransferase family protein [Eubacteriales bacterium]|nr:acyltransferase family protein [Eubacteriales bacterium]MDY3332503.1 acyltransferase family protein [Gallibacter sp.]